MRSTWTDSRLDDFTVETRQRFDRLEGRMDRLDNRMDRLEGRMEQGFSELRRIMIYCFFSLTTLMVTGFVAIETQL